MKNQIYSEDILSNFVHPTTDKIYEDREKKIAHIEKNIEAILETLGLDLTDPSLANTPKRVAKMYIDELFYGLTPEKFPSLSFIPTEGTAEKGQMIVMQKIQLQSTCEHHLLPMIGYVDLAYIPNKKIIGLSKIIRMIQYFAARPQIQERLTTQIAYAISEKLCTSHVAIYMKLEHFCIKIRGVQDQQSQTSTSIFLGDFQKNPDRKKEFFENISR